MRGHPAPEILPRPTGPSRRFQNVNLPSAIRNTRHALPARIITIRAPRPHRHKLAGEVRLVAVSNIW